MTAKKSKTPKPDVDKPEYEPTSREQTAIESYLARNEETPRASLKVSAEGTRFTIDHPDKGIGYVMLMEALGVKDPGFLDGLLKQFGDAASVGHKIDESALNFMLSVVKSIEPKDQLEMMLATQMAVVHMATVTTSRRLSNVETIPQQDSAERAVNKLARTFTTQLEALKRHRSGGQQAAVTVEHVTVNEGGQAIVGNVTHAGKSDTEKPIDQLAISDARPLAMPRVARGEHAAVPARKKRRKNV